MPASQAPSRKSNSPADDPLLGPFLRGGAGNLVLQLALIANNFAVAIALARGLSPAGYGTYTLAFNMVMVLATLAQLGLPTLIVRETARADAEAVAGRAKGIARFALATTTSLVAVITAATGVALLWNLAGTSPALRTTLAVGLAAVPAALAGGTTALDMTGHTDATARATAVAAGVNVAGNLALIPAYGAVGAAVATAGSLVIWNLTLAAAARRRCALKVSAL